MRADEHRAAWNSTGSKTCRPWTNPEKEHQQRRDAPTINFSRCFTFHTLSLTCENTSLRPAPDQSWTHRRRCNTIGRNTSAWMQFGAGPTWLSRQVLVYKEVNPCRPLLCNYYLYRLLSCYCGRQSTVQNYKRHVHKQTRGRDETKKEVLRMTISMINTETLDGLNTYLKVHRV